MYKIKTKGRDVTTRFDHRSHAALCDTRSQIQAIVLAKSYTGTELYNSIVVLTHVSVVKRDSTLGKEKHYLIRLSFNTFPRFKKDTTKPVVEIVGTIRSNNASVP